MKEQDAAHSFEKKERCQYESWVNEYFGLPENFPERAMSMSFDYGQIVNMLAMFDEKRNDFHKQNVENVMIERDLELTRLRSELQQKDEVINELLIIAELYKALPQHNKISLNATNTIIERSKKSVKSKLNN